MKADAAYMRAYRARLKARGRCITCRQRREPGRARWLQCARCAEQSAMRASQWRQDHAG